MSLKITDLRIGNFLKVDKNVWTVEDLINNDSTWELYFKENPEYNHWLNAEPEKLNAVWLIRFGFSLQGRMYKKDRIGIENTIDNDFWNVRILETEETSFFVKEIRFVHELQNAFFFLTDLELQRVS